MLMRGQSRLKFGLDTSCLIPLVSAWHPSHEVTLAEYEYRLGRRQQAVIPAPALLECYSVLTRLPNQFRVAPEAALVTLRDWFGKGMVVGALSADAHWSILDSSARLLITGGAIHDSVIAWTAFRAGATELLTWNLKHFLGVAPQGLAVMAPSRS